MTTLSTDTSFSLAEVSVRLATGHEVARWQTLTAKNHYWGIPGFVGERLYQIAEPGSIAGPPLPIAVARARHVDWLDGRATSASVALCGE